MFNFLIISLTTKTLIKIKLKKPISKMLQIKMLENHTKDAILKAAHCKKRRNMTKMKKSAPRC
jgi:hypothetical protein